MADYLGGTVVVACVQRHGRRCIRCRSHLLCKQANWLMVLQLNAMGCIFKKKNTHRETAGFMVWMPLACPWVEECDTNFDRMHSLVVCSGICCILGLNMQRKHHIYEITRQRRGFINIAWFCNYRCWTVVFAGGEDADRAVGFLLATGLIAAAAAGALSFLWFTKPDNRQLLCSSFVLCKKDIFHYKKKRRNSL